MFSTGLPQVRELGGLRMKFKVTGKVTVYVDTWIEDDEKHDLNDQAYDQIRDLVNSIENTCPGSGDEVTIADIEIETVEKVLE